MPRDDRVSSYHLRMIIMMMLLAIGTFLLVIGASFLVIPTKLSKLSEFESLGLFQLA